MVDVVKFLLDAGIDPRKDADGGRAVSEEAERRGSTEMKSLIKTALEENADVVLASATGRADKGSATAVLDADAAARLAALLANSEAKRQFGTAPFDPLQETGTFSEGRWSWQATVGYGKGDLQAVVSFSKTGSKPQIRVQTLVLVSPVRASIRSPRGKEW